MHCNDLQGVNVVKCHDVSCKSYTQIKQMDRLYLQLCSVVKAATCIIM